jgi:hypothetical protein
MFVQIIVAEGVHDDVVEVLDRWEREVRPGAIGWLGTTAGVTSRGDLVVVARFASKDEARRNSDRAEQGAWWAEAEKRMPGAVRFHDCPDAAAVLDGGDDAAGFVQVMESQPPEPLDVGALAAEMSGFVRAYRPDVLGGLVASDAERLFQVVYFRSEDEARTAEARELPPEAVAELEACGLQLGEIRYHDLRTPILRSP